LDVRRPPPFLLDLTSDVIYDLTGKPLPDVTVQLLQRNPGIPLEAVPTLLATTTTDRKGHFGRTASLPMTKTQSFQTSLAFTSGG